MSRWLARGSRCLLLRLLLTDCCLTRRTQHRRRGGGGVQAFDRSHSYNRDDDDDGLLLHLDFGCFLSLARDHRVGVLSQFHDRDELVLNPCRGFDLGLECGCDQAPMIDSVQALNRDSPLQKQHSYKRQLVPVIRREHVNKV